MLNRWIGILAAAAMLVANGTIVLRDVVPLWIAGDPPPDVATALAPGEEARTQVGIYRDGVLLGRSWTEARRALPGELVTVATTTVLDALALPGGLSTPPVRIETHVTFRQGDPLRVDSLEFRIEGLGVPVLLKGEAMPSGEFPCQWEVGSQRGGFSLDTRAPAALGDVIRPFNRLPGLYVGRSWRLDLVDPLQQILPNLATDGLGLEPVVIRVTCTARITHRGAPVDTFVVEGGGATAWVAADGRVLRQVVDLPLLGELELLDEPYDEAARAGQTLGPPRPLRSWR